LYSIHFIDANTGTAVGNSGTIIRTTNGGSNWNTQPIGTINVLYNVKFTDANNGTVVGDFGTILKTTNGGINWIFKSSGTNNDLNGVFFTDANTATIVGVGGTILRTTTGGQFVEITQTSTVIPEKFNLSQNYPNPFNPVTNIKFDITKSSYVKLEIFTSLGKLVKTLASGNFTAGTYEAQWDASNFGSGIYFCRLSTSGSHEEFSKTLKMVLVK
jgi:photosystem II stability/assembly factor-like uncharacterized protein